MCSFMEKQGFRSRHWLLLAAFESLLQERDKIRTILANLQARMKKNRDHPYIQGPVV